ncbi:MAG: phosphoribosylformylglycinamidine synthase I [Planctomycetes bacterium]|nr:phosphoribosylformylglycinamidine synthase I [Planctomycetota bacterium]
MAAVKALVLRTAGTNCDEETRYAFEACGAEAELVHVNNLVKGEHHLSAYQILALPGGFTYGDDVASGKVFAVELVKALGQELQEFVDKGGLVIGICNGFQVLVKTGLLPDAQLTGAEERKLTLTHNDSHKFEDRWVWLEADQNTRCIFAEGGERIPVPVAHAEGKLVARSPEVLAELESGGQVVYRYINEDGSEPCYPADPNGSIGHIAGICDPTGRIFGLMPHPERNFFPYHHPQWTRQGMKKEGEGVRIFRRAVEACR